MKIVVSDIETNGLEGSDKLWLCGGKDLTTGEVHKFENCHEDPVAKAAAIEWYESADLIVGHNFIQFDAPMLNKLLKPRLIDPKKVIDTLVISRLVNYDIDTPKGAQFPHSLQAWGIRLGKHKGDFHEFDKFSDEMVEYWYGDIEVTHALYEHFSSTIWDNDWKLSLRTEHDVQIELVRTQYYGFQFDKNKAEFLLNSVQQKMKTLEEQFQVDFPPKMEEVNRLKYRLKKDGTEMATVTKAKEKYALTIVEVGEELVCFDWIEFNPGSSKDRIDALWDAGWKPVDKTKTAINFARKKVGDPYGKSVEAMDQEFYDNKKADLDRYGFTVSEANLSTLPDDAPTGAKALAQWLTLEGRRSSLVEWIGQCKDDSRIHGRIQSIGAWTGRCAHKDPNTANISSPFHGDAKSPVEEVKKQYDLHLRACWTVPSGSWLVGTDADGIQLRVLADYLWRHFDADQYAQAIMVGKKEDETDIHNLNKKALDVPNGTRDMAKTFIYAWLLGAGVAKTAQILKVNMKEAQDARTRFEMSIDGLYNLKNRLIPYVAEQGYFKGYDGRKVVVPNAHKALAGILQNGEACLMKHTLLRWHDAARKEGINFKMVGFIHDEYQVEVIGTEEEARRLGQIQEQCMLETGQELGFKIPTPGSSDIGKNWAETH
jgi:DNA polymerase I-like protein with 3'-5' exonuclease and polymerase domains